MDATEKELSRKIFELTNIIQEKYPELYVQLEELRETLTVKEHPEVNIESLHSYYESIKAMLKHYIEEKNKNDLYIINHL